MATAQEHIDTGKQTLDPDLRGFLETNADIVTRITKPVSIDDVGALVSQSPGPIVFDNIKEFPDFSVCDIMVRDRHSQCRALGVSEDDYLPTLAQRLRKAPRGFVEVATGPVKDVVLKGDEVDWFKTTRVHTLRSGARYLHVADEHHPRPGDRVLQFLQRRHDTHRPAPRIDEFCDAA